MPTIQNYAIIASSCSSKNRFALNIKMRIWKTLHFHRSLPLSYDEPNTCTKKIIIIYIDMYNPHKYKRLLEMWTSEWSMVSLICMRIIIHFIYAYTFIYLFICWSLTFTPCNFSSFFVRIPFIKCSKKKKSESLKTFIRSAFRANDSAKRRYACTRYFNNGIRIRCWDCRWNWIVRKLWGKNIEKYIYLCVEVKCCWC